MDPSSLCMVSLSRCLPQSIPPIPKPIDEVIERISELSVTLKSEISDRNEIQSISVPTHFLYPRQLCSNVPFSFEGAGSIRHDKICIHDQNTKELKVFDLNGQLINKKILEYSCFITKNAIVNVQYHSEAICLDMYSLDLSEHHWSYTTTFIGNSNPTVSYLQNSDEILVISANGSFLFRLNSFNCEPRFIGYNPLFRKYCIKDDYGDIILLEPTPEDVYLFFKESQNIISLGSLFQEENKFSDFKSKLEKSYDCEFEFNPSVKFLTQNFLIRMSHAVSSKTKISVVHKYDLTTKEHTINQFGYYERGKWKQVYLENDFRVKVKGNSAILYSSSFICVYHIDSGEIIFKDVECGLLPRYMNDSHDVNFTQAGVLASYLSKTYYLDFATHKFFPISEKNSVYFVDGKAITLNFELDPSVLKTKISLVNVSDFKISVTQRDRFRQ